MKELERYKLRSRILDLPSGSLRIITTTDGKLPVVFLHGAHREFQNASIWLPYTPAFPSIVQPVLIDLPGHGKSPATGKDFRKNHLPLLREFFEGFDFSNVIITARSYGGRLAMKLASIYPDTIKGLFLIAPAGAEKANEYLGKLDIPIQLLWAEDDPIIPVSDIKYFNDLGDKVHRYILPSTKVKRNAHCPEELVPEIFLKLFIKHINRVLENSPELG